ncbi:MAG: methylenetetrahydrofolate reductase [NAD(P)H] [Gammaproteobacteria bacterium]|nr:methylenetetrahydrofolate reductase [NAD(P)H] [Gammaproteobacteria bacterium]
MKHQTSFGLSYEFFPPKSAEGATALANTATRLAETEPAFFSVTFGAGGSTREGTLETVKMLQNKIETPVVPHLSCIGSTRDEIVHFLKAYQNLGIDRIVALRGDLPVGSDQLGEFKFASELVQFIRETTGDHFYIEVAAYPEFHPQAATPTQDMLNLKRKIECGANSAMTQYFYNPDAYFYFIDQCAQFDIFVPIVPGIMPITQFARLARFSDLCGAEIPMWIRKRLAEYGDDHESVKSFGTEVVYNLCQKLIAGGAPGLHFYTLNQADASLQLVSQLFRTKKLAMSE